MNKLNLTNTLIESQTLPCSGQVILRDTQVEGFGVRLTKTCRSFIVEGVVSGARRRLTIGKCDVVNIEIAREQARQILNRMQCGLDPKPDNNCRITLQCALDEFLAVRKMKAYTKTCYRKLVERHLSDWLALPISRITKDMVEQRHKELVYPSRCGTDGKSRANRTFEVLRVVLYWASDKYSVGGVPLLACNTCDRLKQNRQWFHFPPRQGTIPDDRLSDFYAALMGQRKIARDFLLLLLFTGLRRNEAGSLRWADVDFEERTLTIQAASTKGNRQHTLPLSDFVYALLQSRAESGSEYVFPGRDGGHINEPRAVLARLRKQMGWHWLIHDLRRTCLSAGEKAGVPFLTLQKIANHSLKRTHIDRYVVLDTVHLRPHMETISYRLLALMGTSHEQWKNDDTGQPRPNMRIENIVTSAEAIDEEAYW